MKTLMNEQEIWDRNLLRGWTNDIPIIGVAVRFLNEVKPELVTEKGQIINSIEFRDFFIPLNLKRCLDRNSSGELVFKGYGQTRPFISSRCERLNNCLWSEKYTEQELLNSIDAFRWRRHGASISNAANRKSSRKKSALQTVYVKARGLSNTNWNTTK